MAVPDGLIESYSSVTTGNHLLRQKIFTICSTASQIAKLNATVISTHEIFPISQIAHNFARISQIATISFCHGIEIYYVVLVEVTPTQNNSKAVRYFLCQTKMSISLNKQISCLSPVLIILGISSFSKALKLVVFASAKSLHNREIKITREIQHFQNSKF